MSGKRRPVLKLDLFHKLGILIILNIIPIVVLLAIFAKWMRGEIVITNVNALWGALVILLASVVYVVCFWMLMPTARWFKDYSFWQFKQGTSVAWFLPLVMAHVLWMVTWIFCIVAGLAATGAIIAVIVGLIAAVRGAGGPA